MLVRLHMIIMFVLSPSELIPSKPRTERLTSSTGGPVVLMCVLLVQQFPCSCVLLVQRFPCSTTCLILFCLLVQRFHCAFVLLVQRFPCPAGRDAWLLSRLCDMRGTCRVEEGQLRSCLSYEDVWASQKDAGKLSETTPSCPKMPPR